jgi:tetratricopeptide (TPR) repeat protein
VSEPSRDDLLRDLASLARGDTDVAVRRRDFLPTAAHRRALGLDVVVVRGARGAGKTALFKLASGISDVKVLRTFFEDERLPEAKWVDAFSVGNMAHPDVTVLEGFAPDASDPALRAFWMTHLLRRLLENGAVTVDVPEALKSVWSVPAADLATWLPAAEKHLGVVSAALDAAERQLAAAGRYVFAAYDSLDLLGQFDHGVRRRYVSTLLSMWLSLSTRYQHLRGKVFLREDLFDPAELGFVDASKLRARSESLDWGDEALYRLVVRHLANASEASRELLRGVAGLVLNDRGEDGWIPGAMSDAVQRAFVLKIAPRAVGKGVLKSDAHVWLLARLRDSQERITPRALLWFVSFAAEAAQRAKRKSGPLLVAADLLDALRRTSRERAKEIQEEYAITGRMENLRGMHLPVSRADAVKRLQRPVEIETHTRTARGDVVLDEMARVGVLRAMPDGRFDVPDVFRYAFEIGPDYAAAWKDLVEKDDPVARENLMRDLPALGGILREAGVSLQWPSMEDDIKYGRFDEAREKIATSVDLAKSSGNTREEAGARFILGRILNAQRDYKAARREFERSRELFAQVRDRPSEHRANGHVGIAAFYQNDFKLAREKFESWIRAGRAGQAQRWSEVAGLLWLGRAERAEGFVLQARTSFLLARTVGIRLGVHEEWTLRELSGLVFDDGRKFVGAKLATISEVIDAESHAATAWSFAQAAGLTRAQHDALREELRAVYARDRGWSVIREAFPDLPEQDPAGPPPSSP